MPSKKHEDIANRIAKKYNAEYRKDKGADIVTDKLVVEVEPSADTISDAKRQLQGYKKPRYIAVPDDEVAATIDKTKNTKIGVMDSQGNIKKSASRPKKNK